MSIFTMTVTAAINLLVSVGETVAYWLTGLMQLALHHHFVLAIMGLWALGLVWGAAAYIALCVYKLVYKHREMIKKQAEVTGRAAMLRARYYSRIGIDRIADGVAAYRFKAIRRKYQKAAVDYQKAKKENMLKAGNSKAITMSNQAQI